MTSTSASSSSSSSSSRPRVYLDVDIGGHEASYLRGCCFVSATNFRYSWSSKILSELGGSEKSRVLEAYSSDFDWGKDGIPIALEPSAHIRLIFELDAESSPNCAANFQSLCIGDKGRAKGSGKPLHYLNSVFHRMIPGSILQGGDFVHGNGSGGEGIWGGRFKDDKGALKLKHDRRGLLSMCNTGPNSNGSQFFITLGVNKKLDGKHCIFGELVEGDEVLQAIEKIVQVDKEGVPNKVIKIIGCGAL